TPLEFIRDPGLVRWKEDGWSVWYAPQRPDAFLSNLRAIQGNKAYLIYAERACTWNPGGYVVFQAPHWQSDSFNLVGFPVDSVSPPTFAKFFAGSKAHQELRVYRLVDERWVPVNNPGSTPMRAGEACWVYCEGGSDYQGPLAVNLAYGKGLVMRAT